MSVMNGVVLIDKPREWTAHDVCNFLKRKFKFKKVGHAGTLDPNATGVMVVLLNDATKAAGQFLSQRKTYRGVIELGKRTSSYDIDGDVVEERGVAGVTEEAVRALETVFIGDMTQVPPMVSAIKKNGVPLYKLARKGQEVAREPRQVTIYAFTIERVALPFVHFSVSASKGFYVRSLADEIGRTLGCGGMLASLERTASGDFSIQDCIGIEQIRAMKSQDELRPFIRSLVAAL